MVKMRATALIALAGSLALAACANPVLEAQLQQDESAYTAAKDKLADDKSAGTLRGSDVDAYKLAWEKLLIRSRRLALRRLRRTRAGRRQRAWPSPLSALRPLVRMRAPTLVALAAAVVLASCSDPALEARLRQDEAAYTLAREKLAADRSAGTVRGDDVENYKRAWHELQYDRMDWPDPNGGRGAHHGGGGGHGHH